MERERRRTRHGDLKEVNISVRLPGELALQLKERAEVDERSVAGTIRLAIRQYLERHESEEEDEPESTVAV